MKLPDRRHLRGHLRLVALVAIGFAHAGCGKENPVQPGTGGTGGTAVTGGSGGGTGGMAMGGSGGSPTGGSGGSPMAGTGGMGGGAPTDTGGTTAEYFPFKVGNRWTFEVREPQVAAYRKEQVIVRLEKVGGTGANRDTMAFRVETRKFAVGSTTVLEDATISWQLREGAKVLRYRETSCTRNSATLMNDAVTGCTTDVEDHWEPARLRLDERPNGMDLAPGVTWPETYMEYKASYNYAVMPPAVSMTMARNTDTWTVMAANTSVTVPAGTFNNCIVVQKRTSAAQNTKEYTFCKGVGKVKEVGLGQTEELATMPTLR
jgi:hypothetical protein